MRARERERERERDRDRDRKGEMERERERERQRQTYIHTYLHTYIHTDRHTFIHIYIYYIDNTEKTHTATMALSGPKAQVSLITPFQDGLVGVNWPLIYSYLSPNVKLQGLIALPMYIGIYTHMLVREYICMVKLFWVLGIPPGF